MADYWVRMGPVEVLDWLPALGAEPLRLPDWGCLDLCVHRCMDLVTSRGCEWHVSEAITGTVVTRGSSRKQAIRRAVEVLRERSHKEIAAYIAVTARDCGVSPRYREVHHAD